MPYRLRGGFRNWFRPKVETLESRLAPAAVSWDGGANTPNWTDPANWTTDTLPTPADDVTINPSATITVSLAGASVVVQSLDSRSSLSLGGGAKLTVVNEFALSQGKALTTAGVGTAFLASGPSALNGASLKAAGGGALRLPGAGSYAPAGLNPTLQADGAGSLLDLSGLTAVGLTQNSTSVTVRATNGGRVDASKLTAVTDSADGDLSGRAVVFTADGTGSLVDLSNLSSLQDRSSIFGQSRLEAVGGGEVRSPLLTAVDNVGFTISGNASVLPTAQLTQVTNGAISLNGVGVASSMSALAVVDGSSLAARGGATLRLPAVGAYTNSSGTRGGTELVADGAGSVLALPAVATLTGPIGDLTGVDVRAMAGGRVDLKALASAAIPSSGDARNGINFVADGVGSLVDLSSLVSFSDKSQFGGGGESTLEVYAGGEVRAPLLASVDNVGLTIGGAASILPVAQYTSITNGAITVTGAGNTRSFPALATADGSSLAARTGAVLLLPGLTSYTYAATQRRTVELLADGATSRLDLSGVVSLTGPTRDLSGVSVTASAGGRVDLRNLASAAIPTSGDARNGINFAADGAGSLVDLAALNSLTDKSRFRGYGESSLEVTSGGEVRAPLLTSVENVGFAISGSASVLPITQLTRVQNGFIAISGVGNVRVFPNLTNADESYLSARGGATLRLPVLTSYINATGSRPGTELLADGAGSVLDLSAVTSLTGPVGDLTGVTVLASAGGRVGLAALASATIPAGGPARNGIQFIADGPGSLIDLTGLTSFSDKSRFGGPESGLRAAGGGELRVPALTAMDGAYLTIEGAGGILPIAQLRSVVSGAITITGTGNARAFASLTNIDGSSVSARDGAAVSLPGVVAYTTDTISFVFDRGQVLEAVGAGSDLRLPALSAVTVRGALTTTLPGIDLRSLAVGGDLTVPGPVTVSEAFTWTSGTIHAGGTLRLAAEAVGRITGTAVKLLGRAMENAGRLTYDGTGLRLGPDATETGTLINLPGGTLTLAGDGDIVVNAGAGPLTNRGNLVRTGTGTTRVDASFVSSGSVSVLQGTLDLRAASGVRFDGSNYLATAPGSTLGLTTSLLGTTTNADSFAPRGTLTFAGGTAAAPLTLEAMSRDLGPTLSGYTRNFALGTLRLDAAYLRLGDVADNAAGAGAEAVYLDTLIVPAGSTLDLGGIKVYARAVQAALGAVIGGAVVTLPDGGPLVFNTPASGRLAVAGETDEWTFFGRAGQRVVVLANPGAAGSPPPIDPTLGRVTVQALDPGGAVMASQSNTAAGQSVQLSLASLPADGTYRVRVSAPAGVAGFYLLTAYDAPTTIRPLVLGQPTTGVLTTPFSRDRWTFSAAGNQQVRLRLLSAGVPNAAYTLTGPNGFVAFSDIAGDSELVTLPVAGTYTLEVDTGAVVAGGYTFTLDAVTVTTLTLGQTFTGSLTGGGFVQSFLVNVPDGNPLRVTFDAPDASRTEVYVRLGGPPTRSQFDLANPAVGPDHSLLIPFAAPGKWYVLVYGTAVPAPGPFTVRVDSVPLTLTGVTPAQFATGQTATLTVTGAGFLPGTQVELVPVTGSAIAAGTVGVDSTTRLTAEFGLLGVPAGTYGVRVTLPAGTTQTLPAAFRVTATGEARLETRLILPSALGRHATATLYVEYANTGTAVMPAPVLTLQSADPDGSDRPLLTLDRTRLIDGFWSRDGVIPDGYDLSAQIYASGATPGVLQPGERIRVPVYYIGLLSPWNFGDSSVEFEVRVHEAGDTTPIDWAAIQANLRPDYMAADAWAAVVANLQAQVGPTYGDYVRMLSANASSLARLGTPVTDVGELYGFEVQQAVGLSPVRTLASATDAAVPAPGLALSFGRSFGNTITERFQTGPFGRGWAAPWQTRLAIDADGTAVVRDSADAQRRFQPDRRTPGTFSSQAGDAGTLRAVGGGYQLTESNGQVTRFRADGTLESVQDTNGNRVTAGFAGGRLVRLTHTGGGFLDVAYNAAGRIGRITDSVGRVTTYGYDPTDTYLLTVTGPGGTTTYTYTPETAGPRAFALASVTDPGGVARFFEYDARGRLAVTFLSGNAERVSYTYDAAGRVTATDAGGVATSVSFDHRGLVGRTDDGAGGYVRYEYGTDRRLSREIDALGRSRAYTWCSCGSLLTATDEYGRVTTFAKGGPYNQPESFTDANGNVTRYGYDAAGNLTSTTYPDGSIERVAYDAVGNPRELVNRRGQAIGRTFNAAGQLTGETFPDGPPASYTYDARRRLATATDGTGTTTFTYDTADRLRRVDYPAGRWIEYDYDPAGRRRQMRDHSGFVVNYLYDDAGRLKELRDAADALVVSYTYDPAGRLRREDKGNGTYSLYIYDNAGRVGTIVHHAPGGAVNSRFAYGYDAVGRRVRQETSDGVWTYGYDLSGQLTRAVFTSTNPAIPSQDLTYEYDALGNRTRTVLNGVTTVYTTNSLNQYTAAGATTFQHDLDGNLVSESGPGGTTTYTYDSRNRLTGVASPAGTWANEYDVFGNRRASVAGGQRTEYLLDLFGLVDVVGEYTGAGARVASYTHGLGLEATAGAAGRAYYDFDAIGSAAGLSGATDGYVNRYAYEPFGGSLLASETQANSFEFVGALGVMANGTDLRYMRARFFDVTIGRFNSNDPLRLRGGDVNIVRYAGNDPANRSDPSGLFLTSIVTGTAGAALGGIAGVGIGGLVGGGVGLGAGLALGALTLSPAGLVGLGLAGLYYGAYTGAVVGGLTGIALGGFIGFALPIYGQLGLVQQLGELIGEYFSEPPPQPPDPPGEPGGGGSSGTANSQDPNEKLGAAGFGTQGFVATGLAVPYRINFENLGPGSVPAPARPATAPAQRVEVTDQLSASLDWATLGFTEVGFGDTVVAVPAGRQSYSAALPLTFNGQRFDVQVDLTFDPATGLLRAVFQSVDPATSLPPDVLTGFLPPEDGSGRGKGFLAYTVRPRAGLPTGTQLRNVALIVFDGQPAIATNQIDPQDPAAGTSPDREALNTIDAGTPAAAVGFLPAFTTAVSFPVSWAGQDDAGGSGVAFYDVYVSANGGAFTLWQGRTTATSATYPGAVGSTYRFYALATDNVGLAQPAASATIVQTQVVSVLPPNTPPTLSDVTDRTVPQDDGTGPIPVTVGDTITPPDALVLSVTASDPLLVPAGGLVLGGSGANRTLTVTPAAGRFGTAVIRLTVTDADGATATDEFTLAVTQAVTPPPVNTAPRISDVPDQTIPQGGTVGPLAFTVGDDETAADALQVEAVSNSPLVAQLLVSGTGANRTLTIVPAAGQSGTATITVAVRDPEGLVAIDTFTLTVTPAEPPPPPGNTQPTISDLADLTVRAGAAVGPLAFTVGDAETPDALTVTVSSSNPELLPASAVALAGIGAARTLIATPVAGRSGSAVLTVTVTDAGGLTVSDTFTLTVAQPTPASPSPLLAGYRQIAVGSGGPGAVTLYNPDQSQRLSLDPFSGFAGGVRTAAADFTGDGVADLVIGTGPGQATQVVVYDGATQAVLFTIDPFEASFTGGVFVAAGDLTSDGVPELVISPDEGGGPRVRVFDGRGFGQLADFFGIDDPDFRGGARAAVGDITGDGVGDLVVAAGFGGGPRVAVFDGTSLSNAAYTRKPFGDIFVFEETLRNGVYVAAGDLDGDGRAELIAGGGPGGGPRVSAFDAAALLRGEQVRIADFFAGDPNNRGGVRLAVKNLNDDGQADLVAGAGTEAGSRVTAYAARTAAGNLSLDPLFAFDAVPGFSGGVFVG